MLDTLLPVVHIVGLVLAVGAATAKSVLLLRASRDQTFVPHYISVVPSLTRLILAGMLLLILSGVGWLLSGYPLSGHLIAKLVLVGCVLGLGPMVDKVVEPKYFRLATALEPGSEGTLRQARNQYIAIELTATFLFYAIIVYWKVL